MTPNLFHEPRWFIAVGASGSDGFLSIGQLLRELPRLPSAAVLIVLHRRASQPSQLGKVLGWGASMPVAVAVDLEQLRGGCCYVGEPARHLTMAAQGFVRLVSDQFADQHRNRTVDLLFSSVARHARTKSIGVILPGALDDGSRGLAAIHHAGGLTMVLKPQISCDEEMPRNAIAYDGPIDVVGTVSEIAAGICRVVSVSDALGTGSQPRCY